jgi:hypothetical protein
MNGVDNPMIAMIRPQCAHEVVGVTTRSAPA